MCALYNIGKSLKQCNLEDAKSLHLPSTCITLIKLFTWLGTDNLYKQKMHSSREDNKECLTEYIYEKKKRIHLCPLVFICNLVKHGQSSLYNIDHVEASFWHIY